MSANADCSRRIKYDVVERPNQKYGLYYEKVYLPKYSYNKRNLSEVFTCIMNDNPTHDSFLVRVYTDKNVIPINEISNLSLDPLIGLEIWDAAYFNDNRSHKADNGMGSFRYRPILWFPFYKRTVA